MLNLGLALLLFFFASRIRLCYTCATTVAHQFQAHLLHKSFIKLVWHTSVCTTQPQLYVCTPVYVKGHEYR